MEQQIYFLSDLQIPEYEDFTEFVNTIQYNSTLELAEYIKTEIDRKSDVSIIINIEAKIKTNNIRQNHKLLEVLFYLRYRFDFTGVIVCIGFESLQSILKRRPNDLVLCSPGTVYIQFPFSLFSSLNVKVPVHKKDLTPYVKGMLNIEEYRHQHANWWGIKQLFDVHKAVFADECSGWVYPSIIKTELEDIQSLIAVSVYGNSPAQILEQISLSVLEDLHKNKKKVINQIEEIKRNLGTSDSNYDPRRPNISLRKKVLKLENYNYLFAKQEELELLRNNDLARISELEETLISKNKDLLELENRIANFNRSINKPNETTVKHIKKIQNNLSNVKILYIDDKADQGWSEVFSMILFDSINHNNFFKISNDFSSIQNIVNNTLIEIDNIKPNIIFLDLRLMSSEENENQIDDLSGTILLKEIKTKFPDLPVLIVTASNKLLTFEVVVNKLGADGYWMKEGLDTQLNIEFTVNNYIALLNLVERFNSLEYRINRSIQLCIDSISSKDNLWWLTKPQWTTEQTISVDKGEIIKGLKEIQLLYSYYLRNGTANSNILKSILVTTVSLIIERIHEINTHKKGVLKEKDAGNYSTLIGAFWNITNKKWEPNRGDYFAMVLFQYRNCAAHGNAKELTIEDFKVYISVLLTWLVSEEYPDGSYFLEKIKNYNEYKKIKDSYTKLNELLLDMINLNKCLKDVFIKISPQFH